MNIIPSPRPEPGGGCHSVRCDMASRVQFSNAIDYAKFYSRLHDAVIRVYDDAGNVIETHVPQPERCAADTAVMP
jgi:hypothetical protein